MYYTLGLSQRFDTFYRNAYETSGEGQCGTPYQRSGLVVTFSQQDLQRIPYNMLIEVPITVEPGQLCHKFVNVEVQIIATCEIPNSNSQVFQYGVVDGAISYNDGDKIYALNDTATFSVSWPAALVYTSTRRTLTDSAVVDSSNLITKDDMKMIILCNCVMMLAVMLITIAVVFLLLRYHSPTERSPKHATGEENVNCL